MLSHTRFADSRFRLLSESTESLARTYESEMLAARLESDVLDPVVMLDEMPPHRQQQMGVVSPEDLKRGVPPLPPPLGPSVAAIIAAFSGRPVVVLSYDLHVPRQFVVELVGHAGGALDQAVPIVLLNYDHHFYLVSSCCEFECLCLFRLGCRLLCV